jgi:NADH dehydrogenase
LGSETNYFNIPGLEKLSFGFKTINEALFLKQHLHQLFSSKKTRVPIVIVGGGASGVELAGELAAYTKRLARKHNLNPSSVTINLFEAASRLLPTLPEDSGERVKERLRSLGVSIFLNRPVVKKEIDTIYLKDMEMKTKTVIWTAGVKPNYLYSEINGLTFDKKGRVLVDEFLQAEGFNNIFVIGDAASTPFTGMAQTAIRDGSYVAGIITKKIKRKKITPYRFRKPSYAIPVGPNWAVVLIGKLKIYGRIGWWLRRLADLHYFLSILPLPKVFSVFFVSRTLCESCAICEPDDNSPR